MGLPADQLGSEERVIREMHEHWKHLLGAAVICAAAVVGLLVVLALAPQTGFFAWVSRLGWVAFAAVVALFGLWPYLQWQCRTYTLTNQRLACREGVFRRSGRDIPLTRITDVAFEQGILDRMTSAGTLRVSAASERGMIVLRDIPKIHDVVKLLNSLVRQARGEGR